MMDLLSGSTMRRKNCVFRNGLLEEGARHDEVPGADSGGQDQGPHGVVQVQLDDQKVGGDQAAGKDHGEGNAHHHDVPAHQVLSRQGVGTGNRDGHVHDCAHKRVQDCVPVSGEEGGIVQDPPVALQCEAGGPEHHPAGIDRRGIGDGRDHDEVQGIGHHKQAEGQDDIVDGVKDLVCPGETDFCRCMFHP